MANNEFLFKMKGGKLMSLRDLQSQMNDILSNKVQSDFRNMDRAIVQIYDHRQSAPESSPPLRSLGKMPLGVALRKFR